MRIAESDLEKHRNLSGKRKEEPEIAVVAKEWYDERERERAFSSSTNNTLVPTVQASS